MSTDRALERAYPYVIGTICAVLAIPAGRQPRAALIAEMSPQLLLVLAITVGFLATALAILFTANSESIRRLKTSREAFPLLIGYHRAAIMAGLFAAFYSLVLPVVFGGMQADLANGAFGLVLLALWWGLAGTALATFYRAFSLLTALLTQNLDE